MQQIDATFRPPERSATHEEFAHTLRAMLARISALRTLVSTEEDDDSEGQAALDLAELRQGMAELERMTSDLLYAAQEAGGEPLLADLPGLPLGEALSQLVETTAETLGLSSRIAFSGRERPLPDYLTRLLYRIAQEALVHTSEHQGARRLRFSLDYRRTEVAMTIEDDGVPGGEEQFFPAAPDESAELPPFLAANRGESQGAGEITRRLRVMVESLGGAFTINSGIEQGVQVQVCVPYQATELVGALPAAHQEPESAEAPAKVKMLIVDSQAVSRAGLRRLLESYPDLEVVGEAGDSLQAVSETAELLPQVVLIDTQLAGEQSLEALRQVRQLNAEIRVLLLAAREDEELLYEALRAGAGGYVLKDIAPDELAQAVRAAARGEVLVQPQLAARLLTRFGGHERSAGHPQESLTAREREVLQLLARGLRNKEIAARLFVSERTVNFHLANIYAKLHVSGRTEALSKALEQGLLKV